ncbi:hypothetical protein J421_5743 (plasmid) [Gemmatirosa kalamazoonensis]|uniref:Uncharacterized protein n=1 Tax=Gemmatirosa kalamazoonensis TaxID=861299 RepID=W0RUN1_9BACT|nr:hypothetical protein [Gemmatirosa kalamazoonensis]AHG93278.1 hypothetical protein J421_5743 [Gemmatirosa kalamazoonensis]
MSPNVDVVRALELLSQLEPELLAHEAVVPPGRPSPGDGDALDRALRAGLARLRVEIGRETFIYLRWRAERAREAAAAARAEAAALRRTARATRRAADLPTSATAREVRDASGRSWTISEAGPNDLFGGASPRWLGFHSGAVHRQISDYPPDWRARGDEELCQLLTRDDAVSDERPEAPRAK